MSIQMNPRTQKVIREVTNRLYEENRRMKEMATVAIFKPEEKIRVANAKGEMKEYSRGEICRATGLDMSYVSRLFKGVRVPSAETIKLLAWCFETDETSVCRLLKL